MDGGAAHVEIWTALTTIAGAAAAALLRLGYAWAEVKAELREVRANQQTIATKVGVELPHPPTGE